MTSLAAPVLQAAAKPTALSPPVFGPRIIIGLLGVLLAVLVLRSARRPQRRAEQQRQGKHRAQQALGRTKNTVPYPASTLTPADKPFL